MSEQSAENGTTQGLLTAEVVAHIWREHSNCNWKSTGVNVMWSCGIWHAGPIYMQPTTRDAHVAALVMTQVEADREIQHRRFNERLLNAVRDRRPHESAESGEVDHIHTCASIGYPDHGASTSCICAVCGEQFDGTVPVAPSVGKAGEEHGE